VRIKRANLSKFFFLSKFVRKAVPKNDGHLGYTDTLIATSARSTLRRSVSKVAVTSISGPTENINARRLASERRINKALHEEANKDIEN